MTATISTKTATATTPPMTAASEPAAWGSKAAVVSKLNMELFYFSLFYVPLDSIIVMDDTIAGENHKLRHS